MRPCYHEKQNYSSDSPEKNGILQNPLRALNWKESSLNWSDRFGEVRPVGSRPAHILIVNENRADARLMEEALKETQVAHKLTVMGTGEEALEFLKKISSTELKPDIVLLDLYLPRISGTKVLEAIKQDPALRSIPVVVLSGSSKPEDIRESYAAQANCFLQKPMDLNDLVKLLDHITEFWLGFALPSASK